MLTSETKSTTSTGPGQITRECHSHLCASPARLPESIQTLQLIEHNILHRRPWTGENVSIRPELNRASKRL